ncbi:unnamed protein product [Brassicogethes aeneus]|uniref:G-protein coupled receptors family 1 profile domain-containing protein n=1 Tax=Brassicogethes aeneus TaxID=1431903 RepID=A0A9P0FKU7_BRAAE|nr:unnamed protein product [Brassicogethes aeneus]
MLSDMENVTNLTELYESCADILNATYNKSLDENFDIWLYLECVQGAQRQSLYIIVPITIINLIIFVTGLFGNLSVCIVIVKQSTLHTATNYYLFNLAVSDLMLLVFGLPNDLFCYWHLYPWEMGQFFCKIRALLSEMASYVSVLTIVAFSTERYLAICYPLYLHKMSGFQRALRIITVIWVIGFIAALPFAIYTTVNYKMWPNTSIYIEESAFCGMLVQPLYLCEISTITFFLLPLLVIAVQYSRMGFRISGTVRKSLGKDLKGSVHRTNRRMQRNKNVIRMLSFVVLGFFFSWAPFHAQRLVVFYMLENEHSDEIMRWMFITTGLLYYFSSTLNPILYNLMSDRMRNAFREIIFRKKPLKSSGHNSTLVRGLTYHPQNNSNLDTDTEQLMTKDVIVQTSSCKNKPIYEKNGKNLETAI